ncbi:MAG: transcription termination/antitermination protein NusG [Alphaproteobacteria bacterium]|nr:transcription termination/antitermination protein NusG [Alphaproteobacteria bacterium]
MAARWYIVHAYSGFEKKVAAAIRETAAQKGLSDRIEDVFVPTEDVVEVRKGKKVNAERKFFPGYVLVKMELSDETWHMVKNLPKVTGFLGGGGKGRPVPISDKEAEAIFSQVELGVEKPGRSIIYETGEQVKINEGPFEGFNGVVEDVDAERQRVKISVSIFGRPTPVELDFAQVEKV